MEKLEASLIKMGGEGVVCGSRSHLEKESIADRSLLRTILMLGFHMLVYTFGVKSVKDTQCGFKLFSRRVARLCFRYVIYFRYILLCWRGGCHKQMKGNHRVILVVSELGLVDLDLRCYTILLGQ